jgi:hypothetical protein
MVEELGLVLVFWLGLVLVLPQVLRQNYKWMRKHHLIHYPDLQL